MEPTIRPQNIHKKYLLVGGMALLLGFGLNAKTHAMGFGDLLQGSAAFLTHMVTHETGHHLVANMVDGEDVRMDFFKSQGGNFFLGLSSARGIAPESILPFRAAGVVASNHLFNMALVNYRRTATTYNKALLFFSGTDFLWYSVWSFYIKGSNNPSYDPVGIAQETGLSHHAITGAAFLHTAINFYRAYSGNDTLVPYFTLDDERANFGVSVHF
ncbi:MAG: hypothetical protein ACE5GK_09430 [Nitrospiria bacterium]